MKNLWKWLSNKVKKKFTGSSGLEYFFLILVALLIVVKVKDTGKHGRNPAGFPEGTIIGVPLDLQEHVDDPIHE